MKPIYKAIAGVFAATALLSGGALAQVRYESRPAYTEAYPTSFGVIDAIDVVRTGGDNNNSAAGTIFGGIVGGVLGHQIGSGRGNDAATVAGAIGGAVIGHEIGENRSGGSAYRIHVRLASGEYQSFTENDLAGLRVGDRIQIDNGHVFRYVASGERYGSQGYRVDERGNRYYAQSPRGEERDNRYDAAGYRIDERGFRIDERGLQRDAQGYWMDERGNRYDSQGYWVDERGIRHEYQDPPRENQPPPRN